MRVLVTGHRGYIGHVMTPVLEADGHEVIGIDAGLFDACVFGESAAPTGPTGDVRDLGVGELRGFDAVIHLAGLSNDPLGDFDPAITDEINHRAALHLAVQARAAGVARFLFSSSCSVYGAAGEEMIDESAALRPLTAYARSKADAEKGIAALATDRFSPIFLRSATAYGVSARLRFDLVLNNFVAWALTTGRVLLKSDGTAWRPLVHIADIAEAFRAVLTAPRPAVHNQAFNVGRSEENYRARDLAALVCAAVEGARIELAAGAARDARSYRVNCDKLARAVPTFSPRWDVRRGIAQILDACRRADIRADEFEDARYNRIEHLRWLVREGRVDTALRWRDGRHTVTRQPE